MRHQKRDNADAKTGLGVTNLYNRHKQSNQLYVTRAAIRIPRFINELCKVMHSLFLFCKNMSPVMKLANIILIILNSNFFCIFVSNLCE
jgi:hypothetical protein